MLPDYPEQTQSGGAVAPPPEPSGHSGAAAHTSSSPNSAGRVAEVDQAEQAQRIAERAAKEMLQRDAASTGAGVTLVSVAPGMAIARLTVSAEHVNGHGICHGGYLFLLADTAFAIACNSFGPTTVAAGAEIHFLRPVHQGDTLEALAELRGSAGRTGIYDVTVRRVTQQHGVTATDVIAEFRGRAAVIR
jgi:acyl-CoA thioesterase